MFTSESLYPGQQDSIENISFNDDTSALFDIPSTYPGLSLNIPRSLIGAPHTNSNNAQCPTTSATTDHMEALLHPASEGATLCSIAYSIILQNNKKGYDFAQLDLRLQIGYTGRSISAGCTVDNKVLFGVLAEIS